MSKALRSFLGPFLRRIICLILCISACLGMASCATTAQKQASFIRTNLGIAVQKATVCIQRIKNNPAFQNIAQHVPLDGKPTLVHLIDSNIPTDGEIEMLILIHNEGSRCREQAIEDLMPVLPGAVSILVENFHANDLVLADLIQRRITYGEANKKQMTLNDETTQKLLALAVQLQQNLNASHQAELAQRQQVLNALSQWAYQQQLYLQNQQLINSLNRPVVTNCYQFGNSVQCTSR